MIKKISVECSMNGSLWLTRYVLIIDTLDVLNCSVIKAEFNPQAISEFQMYNFNRVVYREDDVIVNIERLSGLVPSPSKEEPAAPKIEPKVSCQGSTPKIISIIPNGSRFDGYFFALYDNGQVFKYGGGYWLGLPENPHVNSV